MADSLSSVLGRGHKQLGSRFLSCQSQPAGLRLRPWDHNLEPQQRPLCDSCEAYSPFSTGKLHPNSPKEQLGST